MRILVTARVSSPSPRRLPGSASRFRSSPGSRSNSSARSSTTCVRSSMADAPANDAPYRLIDDVAFGEGVQVGPFANLYGCTIGAGTRIGPFVEIQRGAVVGARCKVQSHTFVCDGVEIGDEVFVGHGVVFINDLRPLATTAEGELQTDADWELVRTLV